MMNMQLADEEKFQRWQDLRREDLSGAESWLGLVGLYWLAPGRNAVGSAADALVQLPAGPAHLGDLDWSDGRLFWQPVDGDRRELQTDIAGAPSVVDVENWSFFAVDRESRQAVRLRDRGWAAKRPFAGLRYFDYDPAWQIEADWVALSPPLQMEVPNVSGDLKMVEVSHQAVFEVAGQQVVLLPMSVSDEEIFFVFRDRSSGKETYGAGRFLKANPATMETTAGPAVNRKICLNFNFSYNPPCAFTPFATCPLPPPENWLPFAVPAGERKYSAQ